MKTTKAFSLIELMISLITISCITAAFTPVITKKLKNSNVSVALSEVTTKCDKFSSHCTLCYSGKCIACSIACLNSEYKDNDKCACFPCTNYSPNCLLCNAKTCTKCSSGYGIKNSGCEICPKGYYSDGLMECVPCEVGKYQNEQGKSTCKYCEAGKYQDEEGKDSCKIPPNGTYQDQSGQSTTIPCPEDNYCTNGVKTPCPANQGANAGSSACTTCSTKISNCIECSNLTQCTKCKAGYYLSSGSCVQCPAGSSCNGITQAQCPAGQYSSSTASSCTNCPAGKYSSTSGSTTCANCQAGKWSSAGATSCYTCSAGWACNGAGTATKCSAGYYAPAGSSGCSACWAGSYSAAGASTCSACWAGSYSGAGASTCTACWAGSYSNAGASTCTACSSTWANCTACTASGCTTCTSGYKLEGGTCKKAGINSQADCDAIGPNLLFIPKEHNGLKNICVTRCNIGDCGLPFPYPPGVSLVSVGVRCDHAKCCWQDTGTGCDNRTSYSGCKRMSCKYYAAVEICKNFSYGNVGAGKWRLPTDLEGNYWYNNANYVQYKYYGLDLCGNWQFDTYTDKCAFDKSCPGVGCVHTRCEQCTPFFIWLENSSIGIWQKGVQGVEFITNAAGSTRCVYDGS